MFAADQQKLCNFTDSVRKSHDGCVRLDVRSECHHSKVPSLSVICYCGAWNVKRVPSTVYGVTDFCRKLNVIVHGVTNENEYYSKCSNQ